MKTNPPTESFRVVADGDHFCAHRPNFRNLQESVAGYGLTMPEAVADLLRNEDRETCRHWQITPTSVAGEWRVVRREPAAPGVCQIACGEPVKVSRCGAPGTPTYRAWCARADAGVVGHGYTIVKACEDLEGAMARSQPHPLAIEEAVGGWKPSQGLKPSVLDLLAHHEQRLRDRMVACTSQYHADLGVMGKDYTQGERQGRMAAYAEGINTLQRVRTLVESKADAPLHEDCAETVADLRAQLATSQKRVEYILSNCQVTENGEPIGDLEELDNRIDAAHEKIATLEGRKLT